MPHWLYCPSYGRANCRANSGNALAFNSALPTPDEVAKHEKLTPLENERTTGNCLQRPRDKPATLARAGRLSSR